MKVNYLIRETKPEDIDATIDLRGRTRENPVSRKRLNDLGIDYVSISASLSSGECKGFVCEHEGSIIGFCTGNSKTGEVLVLAVAPEHEKKGIGARLLNRVVNWLNAKGHTKVWLAADPDPKLRAFGFYRSQGWQSTGELDVHGDERLEFSRSN